VLTREKNSISETEARGSIQSLLTDLLEKLSANNLSNVPADEYHPVKELRKVGRVVPALQRLRIKNLLSGNQQEPSKLLTIGDPNEKQEAEPTSKSIEVIVFIEVTPFFKFNIKFSTVIADIFNWRPSRVDNLTVHIVPVNSGFDGIEVAVAPIMSQVLILDKMSQAGATSNLEITHIPPTQDSSSEKIYDPRIDLYTPIMSVIHNYKLGGMMVLPICIYSNNKIRETFASQAQNATQRNEDHVPTKVGWYNLLQNSKAIETI